MGGNKEKENASTVKCIRKALSFMSDTTLPTKHNAEG